MRGLLGATSHSPCSGLAPNGGLPGRVSAPIEGIVDHRRRALGRGRDQGKTCSRMAPGSDGLFCHARPGPVRTSEAEDALHVVCSLTVQRFPVARRKYRRRWTGQVRNIQSTHNTHSPEYDCCAEHWRAAGSQSHVRSIRRDNWLAGNVLFQHTRHGVRTVQLPDAGTSHPCLRRPPQATARQGGACLRPTEELREMSCPESTLSLLRSLLMLLPLGDIMFGRHGQNPDYSYLNGCGVSKGETEVVYRGVHGKIFVLRGCVPYLA